MRCLISLFLTLALGFLCCLPAFHSATAQSNLAIKDLRVGQHPDKVRIVLALSQDAPFRSFVLQTPPRLVVDLPTAFWQVSSVEQASNNALIREIRYGALSSETTRIVFDLKKNIKLAAGFTLPAAAGRLDRVVLDVLPDILDNTPQVLGTYRPDMDDISTPSNAPPVTTPAADPTPAPPKPPSKQRKVIVVLDPGHGGKDPGASNGKIQERHIVLSLAKALQKELEDTGRYTVHLTRDSNRFIKLYDRVKLGRHYQGDVFISLHADSIQKPNVRGASIYTLSEKASDAQTAKLAARENKVDLIAGIDLSHEDEDVAGILLDLAQRDTMNQSNFLAEKLVSSLKSNGIRVLDNPHRSAGFAVLKAPDVPSVLIEAGFVSNRHDAKLLSDPSYRKKLADAILEGIDLYVSQAKIQ